MVVVGVGVGVGVEVGVGVGVGVLVVVGVGVEVEVVVEVVVVVEVEVGVGAGGVMIINHPMLFDGDARRRRERAAAEQELRDTLTAAELEARQRGPDWCMAAFDKLIADLRNLNIRP